MTLEELQKEWKAWKPAESTPRSHDEWRKMMYSVPPRVRRMRTKLVVESIGLFAFVTLVIVIADLFSGPLWLTLAFIACNAFYLFNDVLCYHYLQHGPPDEGLDESLIKLGQRMRRLIILSRIAGVLMGLVVLLILILRLRVNADDLILWSPLIPLLIFITWLVSRNWVWRANEVKEMLKLDDDEVENEDEDEWGREGGVV